MIAMNREAAQDNGTAEPANTLTITLDLGPIHEQTQALAEKLIAEHVTPLRAAALAVLASETARGPYASYARTLTLVSGRSLADLERVITGEPLPAAEPTICPNCAGQGPCVFANAGQAEREAMGCTNGKGTEGTFTLANGVQLETGAWVATPEAFSGVDDLVTEVAPDPKWFVRFRDAAYAVAELWQNGKFRAQEFGRRMLRLQELIKEGRESYVVGVDLAEADEPTAGDPREARTIHVRSIIASQSERIKRLEAELTNTRAKCAQRGQTINRLNVRIADLRGEAADRLTEIAELREANNNQANTIRRLQDARDKLESEKNMGWLSLRDEVDAETIKLRETQKTIASLTEKAAKAVETGRETFDRIKGDAAWWGLENWKRFTAHKNALGELKTLTMVPLADHQR